MADKRLFPFTLPPGNSPTIHCTGDSVGPRADLDGWGTEKKDIAPTAFPLPFSPDCSESLYRQRHRGLHAYMFLKILFCRRAIFRATFAPKRRCLYQPCTCNLLTSFLHSCNLSNFVMFFKFLTYVLKQVYVKILRIFQVLITAVCIFLLSLSLCALFSL